MVGSQHLRLAVHAREYNIQMAEVMLGEETD